MLLNCLLLLPQVVVLQLQVYKILEILFSIPLTLEESASCYTYYQPGDFLGTHLDHAEKCVVTVILYLDVVHSDKRSYETGLELHILGQTSSDEDKPQVIIPTKAGSLIIGLGSVNWHKRPTKTPFGIFTTPTKSLKLIEVPIPNMIICISGMKSRSSLKPCISLNHEG